MTEEKAFGRALFFGLLGKVLYCNPTKEDLDQYISQNLFFDPPFAVENPDISKGLSLLQEWADRNREGLSASEYDAICTDYLYLFVGVSVPEAPLWESGYFNDEGMLFQEETLQVRAWYKKFGLACEKKNKEPDDNLGLEFEFLSKISLMIRGALISENFAEAKRLECASKEFLNEHPGRWVRQWSDLVRVHARTDFYRGVSFLAEGSLCVC